MQEYSVTTLDELVEAAKECVGRFDKKALWYRGHASNAMKLQPSLHREPEYKANEGYMNMTFRLHAPMRHAAVPSDGDTAGWLALMRHYGLPSRLLDWTESLLVAAFFAVGFEKLRDGAVIWTLAPEKLNELSPGGGGIATLGGHLGSTKLDKVGTKGDARMDQVVAVMSEQIDLRMLMQQGTYTFHGPEAPLETHPQAPSFLARIVIPAGSRQRMEARLHIAGIRRLCLYPDLENLAKDLRDDCQQPGGRQLPAPAASDH